MNYIRSFLPLLLIFLLACGGPEPETAPAPLTETPQPAQASPTPNLEATVEARVQRRLAEAIELLEQTSTATPTPPPTATPSPTPTATPTGTPPPTSTPLSPNTPSPSTPAVTPTATPLPTATRTPRPTATASPPTPSPTVYRGPTEVSGRITVDTLWTAGASPFKLTNDLTVPRGVSLEIGPGVIVDFNGFFMVIEGELRAIGQPDREIRFVGSRRTEDGNYLTFTPTASSWVEDTGEGSVVRHAIFAANTARARSDALLKVDGSAPLLDNIEVTNLRSSGIYLQGPAILENSRICNNFEWGVLVTASAIIRNNEICENRIFGIRVTSGSPLIVQNIIHGNNWEGLEIRGGISIELTVASTGSPEVRLNNIWQNLGFGLRVLGERVSDDVVITQNSFTENEPFNARLGQTPRDVNMTRNWWGTGDRELIREKLHDEGFEFGLREIDFLPRLNEPPAGVPTLDDL